MLVPYIHAQTDDFAVIYKPPLMHCAPLSRSEKGKSQTEVNLDQIENYSSCTLLDWYARIFPVVLNISGKKPGEGGLLHRLDFHTQGLVLFAKNQKTYDFLSAEQEQGSFIKEYQALCFNPDSTVLSSSPGFPPCPMKLTGAPMIIESYFRSFGPGRKEVRPVIDSDHCHRKISADKGAFYKTEICSVKELESTKESDIYHKKYLFDLRIKRGFRHQIRCHLAWIGYPIINDPVYSHIQAKEAGFLALFSKGLLFRSPDNIIREYRITT